MESPLGLFERYTSVWVAFCVLASVGLGLLVLVMLSLVAFANRSRHWFDSEGSELMPINSLSNIAADCVQGPALLGRWMRMLTIANQSSVTKAFSSLTTSAG